MSTIKIELDSWNEAEIDLESAREIAGMLSHELYLENHKQYSSVAYAIERLIESAQTWIESGRRYRKNDG